MLAKILRISKYLVIGFFVLSVVSTIFFRFVNPPFTPLMLSRCVEQLWEGKEMKLKKEWVSIENISSNVPLAMIASEDQLFLEHYGFDFKAIEDAVEKNAKRKRKRGASTISQQVAKNVFLWQGRTWLRKGLEVYFTVLIEIFWSKERIIEVYMNVAELGNGVYGVEAASNYYYHKSAAKLSRGEAAYLAAILPNPRRWSPVKPTTYLQVRQSWILGQMKMIGKIAF